MMEKLKAIQVGAEVKWEWADRYAEGKVVQVHLGRVSRIIQGYTMTITGHIKDRALIVEYANGSIALLRESQVKLKDFDRH